MVVPYKAGEARVRKIFGLEPDEYPVKTNPSKRNASEVKDGSAS